MIKKKRKNDLARFEKFFIGSEQNPRFPLSVFYPPSDLRSKNYIYTYNREGIIMQECWKDDHYIDTFIPRGDLKERAFDLLIFTNSSSNVDIDELADDRLILAEQGGLFNLVIFG